MMDINIDWEKVAGLLPVIVQDETSKEVLMLAFMNKEAYELTCKTSYAHYFSRTKQRIWKKGESSGNVQEIKAMFLDCDNDTLLLQVKQIGEVACHTGRKSCFFQRLDIEEKPQNPQVDLDETYSIIDTLYHVIKERKNADPEKSYVSKLLNGKENSLLKKIVEEAGEFCFACKDKDEKEVVYECADLVFHMLVALEAQNIHPDRVKTELKRRFGLSGIEEKKQRK
ncbi:MAG: bifunctional phosphoribosyl-AMP cyclohydrolase/phosphoribosyl-ATP pyrophosphatase [Proteobacteria bacterium]|nr:MAG: bifunctional phosphoribosyl-AMP cyclohydrolase/phosphoribosyl-ATP pyrophosphatase [Pseudomonadota bacterium]